MGPDTIWVLIPLAGMAIPMIAIWSKHQQRLAQIQAEATSQNTAERAAQYAAQVQKLEDRVRVLERIVTDGGYDVATQIEALRDTRKVEEQGSGVPLRFVTKESAQ